jgi:WD40 repeat protein
MASLWEGEKRIRDFKSDESELFSASFSPDGQRIVTASANGTAQIWNLESNEPTSILKGHIGPCRTAAFSADGQRVVTAGDTTVRLWDSRTGKLIQVFDKSRGSIIDAKLNPSQSRIVTLIKSKPFVYLSNTKTGALIELSGAAAGSPDDGAHTEQVVSVAISSDGQKIITASNDGTARIWNGETGAPVDMLRYSKNPKALTYVAIRPDSSRIATTSRDGTAQLWPIVLSPTKFVELARRKIPRCLTDVQRQKYGLAVAPPAWCIELEKWPYQTQDWKIWLKSMQAGFNPPLPSSREWRQWISEHS